MLSVWLRFFPDLIYRYCSFPCCGNVLTKYSIKEIYGYRQAKNLYALKMTNPLSYLRWRCKNRSRCFTFIDPISILVLPPHRAMPQRNSMKLAIFTCHFLTISQSSKKEQSQKVQVQIRSERFKRKKTSKSEETNFPGKPQDSFPTMIHQCSVVTWKRNKVRNKFVYTI